MSKLSCQYCLYYVRTQFPITLAYTIPVRKKAQCSMSHTHTRRDFMLGLTYYGTYLAAISQAKSAKVLDGSLMGSEVPQAFDSWDNLMGCCLIQVRTTLISTSSNGGPQRRDKTERSPCSTNRLFSLHLSVSTSLRWIFLPLRCQFVHPHPSIRSAVICFTRRLSEVMKSFKACRWFTGFRYSDYTGSIKLTNIVWRIRNVGLRRPHGILQSIQLMAFVVKSRCKVSWS
jgi:hypothetical protein